MLIANFNHYKKKNNNTGSSLASHQTQFSMSSDIQCLTQFSMPPEAHLGNIVTCWTPVVFACSTGEITGFLYCVPINSTLIQPV